ncbi:M-phase inducer phosphatase-like [Crassostrea angulata]|uniref:M-phase inducer phosphatase-like n=1 Tax=Magallana angulata TaxID=2784310 RepID=UPI0022B0FE58|nr:M-phase inducer phosphatase-like [Crassostrea angulata]
MDGGSAGSSRLKWTESKTGSKMVSCSLQFDESSDDDLEKLMTPSSKRKLDLSHVSHMSHMSIASPMQEYVSPCFQELFQSNGPRPKRFRSFESRKNLFQSTVKNQFSESIGASECKENHSPDVAREQKDKTGDGKFPLCLPTIPGNVQDLHTITPQILSDLLQGVYKDTVQSFRIIDCRYPYEYAGGHIKGAENIFTEEGILHLLHQKKSHTENGRSILIFHCEFSSERGPRKCRFLRNKDRQLNKDKYPNLNHPEVYLLHGGYKAFYQNYKELCEPPSYVPMLHKEHANDLRVFRKKSKSWTAGEKKQYALMNIQI